MIEEKQTNLRNLSRVSVGRSEFGEYDIHHLELEPILYQTGYLTISDYDEKSDRFTLDYPNLEVRSSLATSLMKHHLRSTPHKVGSLNEAIILALLDGKIDDAMKAVQHFLASIPYIIVSDTENYYQTAVYLIFSTLGLPCRAKFPTATGRIDLLIVTRDYVYCFEFKLNKPAAKALEQIDEKEYLLPWMGSKRKLYKIGVSISTKKRNITSWKYAVVDPSSLVS